MEPCRSRTYGRISDFLIRVASGTRRFSVADIVCQPGSASSRYRSVQSFAPKESRMEVRKPVTAPGAVLLATALRAAAVPPPRLYRLANPRRRPTTDPPRSPPRTDPFAATAAPATRSITRAADPPLSSDAGTPRSRQGRPAAAEWRGLRQGDSCCGPLPSRRGALHEGPPGPTPLLFALETKLDATALRRPSAPSAPTSRRRVCRCPSRSVYRTLATSKVVRRTCSSVCRSRRRSTRTGSGKPEMATSARRRSEGVIAGRSRPGW